MRSRYTSGPDEVRYDPTTIWLHWATAVLIVVLWVIGQTADFVPRGPFRSGLWSVHVLLGAILGLIFVARIVWRTQFGRVLPPAETGVLHAMAQTAHIALYVLLGATLTLGLIDTFYRGFSLFGLWSLPQIGTNDPQTRHDIDEWHELAANLTVVVVFLHASAALVHEYVWRDHLLRRMTPRWREAH
jgi:cytochrome b561